MDLNSEGIEGITFYNVSSNMVKLQSISRLIKFCFLKPKWKIFNV